MIAAAAAAPFLLELSAQGLPPMRLLKAYRKLHLRSEESRLSPGLQAHMLGRLEKDGADIAVLRQVLAIQNRAQAQQIVDRYFPSPAQQATYRLPCTLGRMFEK